MKEEVLELIKSGDFTIIYHDSHSPSLYKGKGNYEDFDENTKDYFAEEYLWENGYIPGVVSVLVEALGGAVDSV